MKLSTLKRMPARWRPTIMRTSFNLHPAFRGTGGRVEYISPDLMHIRVRLPLLRRTRNFVGSIFGGSLFSVTDGVHVMMLLANLHRDVIVWDKAASIRYRKPAFSTLYVDFHLSSRDIDDIHQELDAHHETEKHFTIALKDQAGTVHTIVERTIYLADKAYYKTKARA